MVLQDDLAMSVSYADGGGGVTLALQGEIDFGNVAQVRSKLLELIRAGSDDVTVDLAGVTFLDSTTIGVLIQAKKRLAHRGGQFALVNPQPRVTRVFEVAGLIEYLGL